MSTESAMQWIMKLHEDDELRQKTKSAENFEARLSVAREYGFEFTKAEIEKAASSCTGELSEDDLDAVAGGRADPGSQPFSDNLRTAQEGIAIATAVGAM